MSIKASKKTLYALNAAIKRGDSIWNLELVGVDVRTLDNLEAHGILTIEQVLNMTRDDLANIREIGVATVNRILQGILRYEETEAGDEQLAKFYRKVGI